jgi:transglutaminase-like putative cysteine protease
MPTYKVHHTTKYTYDEPVSVCHNLAHLLPREAPRHRWRFAELEITPQPAVRAERPDFFGNQLTFFAIQEPHRVLTVTTDAQVELDPPPPATLFSNVPWEQVRDRLLPAAFAVEQAHKAEFLDAFQFTFPSPYVRWTPEVAAYAAPSFAPGRPLMEAVMDFSKRIHTEFKYDTTSTTVSSTLPEVMAARAGVCQDFAHLMVGGLRAVGLAARYVSGYLLTAPPPGKERLVGADASHAWVSVFAPDAGGGAGWIDVDPTNNCTPQERHITLAWGRDYGDVSPLRGVILGGGRHQVRVAVDVAPVA